MAQLYSVHRFPNLAVLAGNSERTPWYTGDSLLRYLECVAVDTAAGQSAFRYPVQWVNRPDAAFRGYAGTVASGTVHKGQRVVVTRTGYAAHVDRIVTIDGDRSAAAAGDAVTLTLDRDVDISRGDVLATPDAPPEVADQFAAHVIWMNDAHLLPGRTYLLKTATRSVSASVTEIKHRIDIETFKPLAARSLGHNDTGLCNLTTSEPIAFDPYDDNRTMGSFIVIDRFSNATVAAGMIRFALRRATTIHPNVGSVDKAARAELKRQRPFVVWFTGLSGAGKSTIANRIEHRLLAAGRHTYLLDGDNVRSGLSRDLGFTDADRVENVRRVAETAKLLVDAGLIVLVCLISPFEADRLMARELFEDDEFVEVFVDVPLDAAEGRDPKGLYRRARGPDSQLYGDRLTGRTPFGYAGLVADGRGRPGGVCRQVGAVSGGTRTSTLCRLRWTPRLRDRTSLHASDRGIEHPLSWF